jgi:single-stranded DNA-binding protein
MNNVVISGVVFNDVNVRPVQKTKVANFSLLKKDDKNNIYIQCEAWGALATEVDESMRKGDAVVISGSLRQDSYEKDGEKKVIYKIRLNNFSKGDLTDKVEAKSPVTADVDSDVVPF